jgi:hypothetical protein
MSSPEMPTALLRRLDPCEDPQAEPVTRAQVLALLCATSVAAFFWLRWKFQPMQDLGHHVGLAAVTSDWGRPGSIYTALYQPIDHLAANSLLWSLSGLLGRAIGVTLALRLFLLLFYVAGLPWVVAWALRARGRSIWPAVATAGLVHLGVFTAGFANFLFAAPLLVIAVVQFARLLEGPTAGRTALCALLAVLVFVAHAHIFLWLGGLWISLLLRAVFLSARGAEPVPWGRRVPVLHLLVAALLAALPALLLLGRWYVRTFVRSDARVGTSGASEGFGATFKSPHELIRDLPYSVQSLQSGLDLKVLLFLLLVAAFALWARRKAPQRELVLELCCVLSLAAYFVLPEWLRGHDSLGSRQPAIALWFLPALLAPVPDAVSRLSRRVVIGGVLAFTAAFFAVWSDALWKFETLEVAGLEEVMSALPPRARLHMVKIDPDSRYFTWRSLWHVEKYVMSDHLGQTPDTAAILATCPIHYRPGIDIHRIVWGHDQGWPRVDEAWANFDAILVRRWRPPPAMQKLAEQKGVLLKKSGEWELWAPRR